MDTTYWAIQLAAQEAVGLMHLHNISMHPEVNINIAFTLVFQTGYMRFTLVNVSGKPPSKSEWLLTLFSPSHFIRSHKICPLCVSLFYTI
jgi:hypothetical protein